MENRCTVDQKMLAAVLASMQPICAKRTTLDATSAILFQVGHKELVLKSTDLEISLQYSCPLKESSVQQNKTFLVSGKRVFDLVRELDGEIQCNLDSQQLSLQSGKARLALHIKDSQEFPPFPERIENLMHFDAPFLLEMINKVAFLIPQNNSNPALNGLLFEISASDMKMTATDGHCLAQVTTKKYMLQEPKKWLLPRRAIFELKKILESCDDKTIFLGICGNQLVFSGESFNFFTKLLADQFPAYAAILQKDDFDQVSINRAEFVKTLRRSSCLLSGQFIATKFDFDQSALKISLHNKEVGTMEEELVLHGFGGSITVRFYAPYLLNGLQAFTHDTVIFYLKGGGRPILFESIQDDLCITYLVMPVAPTNN